MDLLNKKYGEIMLMSLLLPNLHITQYLKKKKIMNNKKNKKLEYLNIVVAFLCCLMCKASL